MFFFPVADDKYFSSAGSALGSYFIRKSLRCICEISKLGKNGFKIVKRSRLIIIDPRLQYKANDNLCFQWEKLLYTMKKLLEFHLNTRY